MKKIDLQGAILAGIGTLIIGLTGWLMTTTLGVDKDQDVMEDSVMPKKIMTE